MNANLFVYGTLRSDQDNEWARFLKSEATMIARGSVAAVLHPVGEYTGMVADPGAIVRGEVRRIREPERVFVVLDEYEGVDYARHVLQDQPLTPTAC
jgi:gamma-glutamylcyclotransferase (GGCT)/AIG2-like uncharacterized protein YtfP